MPLPFCDGFVPAGFVAENAFEAVSAGPISIMEESLADDSSLYAAALNGIPGIVMFIVFVVVFALSGGLLGQFLIRFRDSLLAMQMLRTAHKCCFLPEENGIAHELVRRAAKPQ